MSVMRSKWIRVFLALFMVLSLFAVPLSIRAEGDPAKEYGETASVENPPPDEGATEGGEKTLVGLEPKTPLFEDKLATAPGTDGAGPQTAPEVEGNYTIIIYYVYAGPEQKMAATPYQAEIMPGWDHVEVVNSPDVEGYLPDQPSVTLDFKTFTGNTEIYVLYQPKNVNYETHHLLENIAKDHFELAEEKTVVKQAPVDSIVTAEPLNIEGFTAIPPYQEEKVPAKGILQLEVKYARNTYTLSYDTDGGSYVPSEIRAFEEALTPPAAPTKPGFKFVEWEPTLPQSMPAQNLVVKAKWEPIEGTPYKYAYYLQNADDDNYTLLGLVDAVGKTGDLIAIPQNGKGLENLDLFPIINDGYASYGIPRLINNQTDFEKYFVFDGDKTSQENQDKRIDGDGKTIAPLYFNRQVYTIVFGNNPSHYNDASRWFPEFTKNGVKYSRNNLYTIQVRYGEDFSDRMVYGDEITNLPEGYSYERPLFVKGRGYGSWISAQPPFRFTSYMAYCAPQTVVEQISGPYTQYFALNLGRSTKTLDVYEYFQEVDGSYKVLTEPTRRESMDASNWYYSPSQYAEYMADYDHMDFFQERDDPRPNRGFLIYRNGKPSLHKGDIILDKRGHVVSVVDTDYPREVDGVVHIYYARKSFPVTFWLDPAKENTDLARELVFGRDIDSILPDASTIQANKPDTIPDNYEFKGWYKDQTYQEQQKLLPNTKMEPKPLQLFAKWGPPEGDIKVTIDPDNGTPVSTITVVYGAKVDQAQAGTPEKSGYQFVGWYILEENGNLSQIFDFNRQITAPLALKAKYRENTSTSITVQYLGQEGNPVADEDQYTHLPIGKDYTYKAKVVEKMLPDAISKNLKSNLVPEENVLKFNYIPFTTVDYTVKYIVQTFDEHGQVTNEEAIKEERTVTTDKNVVTEDAPGITGYVALQRKKTIPLSQRKEDNVMIFYYRKDRPTEAAYTIEYYLDKDGTGNYQRDDHLTKILNGPVGSQVELKEGSEQMPLDINGLMLNREKSQKSGTVLTGPELVLKLYYDRLFTITYLANGGNFAGGQTEISTKHKAGDQITINAAPVWAGHTFLYWKGSRHNPGDKYTVVGDHTFTAIWDKPEGPDQPKPDKPQPYDRNPYRPSISFTPQSGFVMGQPGLYSGAKQQMPPKPLTQLPATGSTDPAFVILLSLGLATLGLFLRKHR
ncbi:MAG: InlB B-repeat-containing protein [Clostridiales bacterium]|nr:InlB B-repeat-containing protein [Clostridiales bacterium]MDD7432118.1 InlB B-repeat-containing protein [Clostridiales bacterium]MDY3061103.1 InlB B-repeat-containing protein [Eubacteriales bacterium]